MREVPYYAQWESPELVAAIVAGTLDPAEDPRWAESGARDAAEYARWSGHVCGMACLKMLLAARSGRAVPTLELARRAAAFGAYVDEGDAIRGLIYAPCVEFLRAEHGIESRVVLDVAAADLPALLREAEFFLASVHPDIRWPERPAPPGGQPRGGHLVLVTAADAASVAFHNPSGHDAAAQRGARLSHVVFDRFFAGRGIAVR